MFDPNKKLDIDDTSLRVPQSYKKYVEAQVKRNSRVVKNNSRLGSWVGIDEVQCIVKWLKKYVTPLSSGMCHGTRYGREQQWFAELLGLERHQVLGTDIAPKCEQFGNIHWDFHDLNDEWINKFDFIYSNSLDHSYNPIYALQQWSRCLRNDKSVIVLAYGTGHKLEHVSPKLNEAEVFHASLPAYRDMIEQAGGHILTTLRHKQHSRSTIQLVINFQQ